jgi:acid phosphatase family membrane protein YuiD
MLIEQNKALASLTVQLDLVNKTLAEAKGGWKTLVWLGGMSAAASAMVTWALTHIPFVK